MNTPRNEQHHNTYKQLQQAKTNQLHTHKHNKKQQQRTQTHKSTQQQRKTT